MLPAALTVPLPLRLLSVRPVAVMAKPLAVPKPRVALFRVRSVPARTALALVPTADLAAVDDHRSEESWCRCCCGTFRRCGAGHRC